MEDAQQRNMETPAPFSEKLFFSLVQYIKDTCRKNVKFDDFVSVSGFLSFDVDGKTQHRFVLNEIIDKANNREGSSIGVGTVNWSMIKKIACSKKEIKSNGKKNNSCCSPKVMQSEFQNTSGPSIIKNTSLLTNKHSNMQKSLSGPVAYLQFSNNKRKKNNRTFTRENSEEEKIKQDATPKRTFSNSTVNLSTCKSFNEGYVPSVSSAKSSSPNTDLPINGLKHNKPNKSAQQKNVISRQVYQGSKDKPIGGADIFKRNKALSDNAASFQVFNNSLQKNQHSNSPNILMLGKTMLNTSNEEWGNFFQKPVLKREDSDISIGSTRPKYLVQHNGELLMPCPKLGDIINSSNTAGIVNVTSDCEKDTIELKDSISVSSHETNYSSSSVEMDPYDDILVEKVKSTPFILSQDKFGASKQIRSSLSFQKKKSKMFKWMKLFKKDCHQLHK